MKILKAENVYKSHGHLALGELVDFLLGVQLKFVQQSLGVVHVPVGAEDGRRFTV